MVSKMHRPNAMIREQSFLDFDKGKTKPRSLSPASVRCSPEVTKRKSLVSSLKQSCRDDSLSSYSTISTTSSDKKKVAFESWVGVKATISRHDMTEQEHEDYWFQDEDYLRIKRRNRVLIRLYSDDMFKGKDGDDDLLGSDSEEEEICSAFSENFEDDFETSNHEDYPCIRGLNLLSVCLRRKFYRRKSLQKVLIEQEFQVQQGIFDDEMISEIYSSVCSPCKYRAVHLAMDDRIAAEQIYHEDVEE